MVSLVKHWREASTVIIAAKSSVGHLLSNTQVSARRKKLMCDYKTLLLRRSGKQKYFANVYVHPGGVVDDADFSDDWAELFHKCGVDVTKLGEQMRGRGRTPLMSRIHKSVIPNEIGFRICAIREAFEESGILLARGKESLTSTGTLGKEIDIYDEKGSANILKSWRTKIHEDGKKFNEFCKEFSLIPDVWGLIEWSDWLTPCFLPPPGKRFDAVTFLCATDKCGSLLDITHDQTENTMLQWYSPDESLTLCGQNKITFNPPQIYEMARLCRHPKLEELVKHASERAALGCERWLPVHVKLDDGNISCLPGDTLYPEKPDLIGEHPIPTASGSEQSRREKDKQLNRFELNSWSLVCNQSKLYLDQTAPICIEDFRELMPPRKGTSKSFLAT